MNTKHFREIFVGDTLYKIFDINKAASDIELELKRLPYSLRILFENVVRHTDKKEDLLPFKEWLNLHRSNVTIPFVPARVLMQDFTGVPAIADLATMRDAMKKLNNDPLKVNPLIPVDLVIDHSVQVDYYGTNEAFDQNVKREIERNLERYEFLKWGQESFDNFRVVPPGTGICHQVNLEYLANVVWTTQKDGATFAYPDTVFGTDSHTTMINGLAVLGWGVGGIEAEAAMLGRPLAMILPEVIGFKLTGSLEGMTTATDLVLTITQMLREKNVVGKFVEFYGDGLDLLSLADRATIANMAPEYGATCGFFPIDNETIKYLNVTARSLDRIELVQQYAKLQLLWRDPTNIPEYTDILELDLSNLNSSVAGPRRPQDRVNLKDVASNFQAELPSLTKSDINIDRKYQVMEKSGLLYNIGHGDVVIAAITSCTNTSNPAVMIGAGLLAKKAVELGLRAKPWVKTSLAPGSKVVMEYLKRAGLDYYLNELGFYLVGYGCTTCIGNSGPLTPELEKVIMQNNLVVASVLSGNRNFEGRIHPLTKASYLASPLLVVAYALLGTINVDLETGVIGKDQKGGDIYLKDIWPTQEEIKKLIDESINSEMFKNKYADVFLGDQEWRNIKVTKSDTYNWHENSTYISNPPYFADIEKGREGLRDIKSARILAILGDSVTTDHISPAGSISILSPAAQYLTEKGVSPEDFNSYGARRGNHEVMMRGTFANNRIKNAMCPGIEGGVTINQLNGQQMTIYDAAMNYKTNNIPLVIFAGKEYGSGSSRDWAAKGTALLGVKVVIADSFERIHRSNLVGMGILPLMPTECAVKDMQLDGSESISLVGLNGLISPYAKIDCIITRKNGIVELINLILQAFTYSELDYLRCGSIMHSVLSNLQR